MESMKRVSIKRPSDRIISRMRNGHQVRMMKGEGLDIMMKPSKILKMAKKFMTGKGIQISLDPEELESNKEIEGCGIFGKKADKWMEKKGIKKAAYALGSVAKPFVQEGIKAAEAMATAYGVPPEIASKIGGIASQYVDDPESLQGKKGRRELKKQLLSTGQELANMGTKQMGMDNVDLAGIVKKATAKRAPGSAPAASMPTAAALRTKAVDFAGQSLADKLRERFSDAPGGQGLYAGRGIGMGIFSRARREARQVGKSLYDSSRSITAPPVGGFGMFSRMRPARMAERSIMGRNSLIGGEINPALASQPYGANYQFQYTLGLPR